MPSLREQLVDLQKKGREVPAALRSRIEARLKEAAPQGVLFLSSQDLTHNGGDFTNELHEWLRAEELTVVPIWSYSSIGEEGYNSLQVTW